MSSTDAIELQVEPPQPIQHKPINIVFSSDAFLFTAFIGWLLWDKLGRSSVVKKLDGVFAPIEEQRSLNNILAQIGVITSSSRVILAAFHNGAINTLGYHLTKISTINTYTAPGRTPMSHPIKDLPIGRIMYELEDLLRNDTKVWSSIQYSDDLPEACKDHLTRNNIDRMYNRLVRIGNLPIGIISLQYDATEMESPPLQGGTHASILEDLCDQISTIMRRRIVHPGPFHKFLLLVKRFKLLSK